MAGAWMPVLLLCLMACQSPRAESPLPDPFVFSDGARVRSHADWERRRAEMIAQLEAIQYGKAPPLPDEIAAEDRSAETRTLGHDETPATLVTATLRFDDLAMRVGYWLPSGADAAVPVLLASEPVWWNEPFVAHGIAERVVARGYAFAGFWVDDLASFEDPQHRPAQDAHPEHDWGTVAVAAWGYRIAMTWLETIPEVDTSRVAVWGHSRRGKSCIWAAVLDERFAAAIPHMSGMAGTAAYRVRGPGAQRLEQLLERYWLHPRMFDYAGRKGAMPFDQHWLHALMAPRPMYAHVGADDAWGNPMGEEAAWLAGRVVYRWLDAEERLGIHFGDYGHHDPNGPEGGDSWETALDFLDWQFRDAAPRHSFAAPRFTGQDAGPDWDMPESPRFTWK